MKLSQISKFECGCGHHGSLAFFASNGFQEPCPKCGTLVQPESQRRAIDDPGNRRFSGDGAVSLKHGCLPSEVQAARRSMPEVADCFRDNGQVVFKDSRTAKKFEKAMDRVLTGAGVPKHPF